jgi:hypothetical protein
LHACDPYGRIKVYRKAVIAIGGIMFMYSDGSIVSRDVLMARHRSDVARHYGDYDAYVSGEWAGDAELAFRAWLDIEIEAGALTERAVALIPVAEHWEPSSDGYRQSLVLDESGRAYAVLFEYGTGEGNWDGQWHEVEWYEGDAVPLAYVETVTTAPEWFAEYVWEGAYEGAPAVASDGSEVFAIKRANGTYDMYEEVSA